MNNLLRTLTESQVKSAYPDSDLKLLLTTVKESRRQSYDNKVSASDAFYDSLEGLLNDLKTVTIDNHDAEAFLKPVSKAEAPDYYDVISHPMDFATMLKKVKTKQYKSKREFKDDLELIWFNCLTYNAAENHPLRPCVKRLKQKAERLLKYVTDRKERMDPPIPSDIVATHVARPKVNGAIVLNGRPHPHHRSSSTSTVSKSTTPTLKPSPSLSAKSIPRRDTLFADSPVISRTAEGMALFSRLDREIGWRSEVHSNRADDTQSLLDELNELACPIELPISEPGSPSSENTLSNDDSFAEKRKINGSVDGRPRKRQRLSSHYPTPVTFEKDDPSSLWWGAVQSDFLLANGLPHIPFPSSSSSHPPSPTRPPPRARRRWKSQQRRTKEENAPKSLLMMMNNNIKTMKRLRHTHVKFAALNLNSSASAEDSAEGGISGDGITYSGGHRGPSPLVAVGEEDGIEAVDDKVDERSWTAMFKGKRKVRDADIGEPHATDCMRWMTGKILEHSGFQGSSKIALEVLAGVTSEYLLNVGRTIRYLCDNYSNTMSPEEIILHTLFESGTSKVQDLERYISDDVERYGARLLDLEKKLVGAYREHTAVEALEDEGLFEDEEEDEAGALAIGDFADALGEDYLGLRELGIAAEFGLSNLSIPKKLLRSKKKQRLSSAAAKPVEPPPPYPPPPPFIPLTSDKIDDHIGLLKPYFQTRFSQLAAASQPPPLPPPPLPPVSNIPGPSLSVSGASSLSPQPSSTSLLGLPANTPEAKPHSPSPPTILTLPDDLPNPVQVKMSPLGQIVKSNPAGTTAKKKKASGVAASAGPGGVGTDIGVPVAKKKQGMAGIGPGNGRKKKGPEEGGGTPGPAPVIAAGGQQPQQTMPPSTPQLPIPPHSHVQYQPMAYGLPPAMTAYALPMAMQPQPQPQPPIVGQ